MVEQDVCNVKVASSILVTSTKSFLQSVDSALPCVGKLTDCKLFKLGWLSGR